MQKLGTKREKLIRYKLQIETQAGRCQCPCSNYCTIAASIHRELSGTEYLKVRWVICNISFDPGNHPYRLGIIISGSILLLRNELQRD